MEPNDFYDLIKNRRSVRSYDPGKVVSDDILKRVLNAGRLAPTSSNRQPVNFHLIKSREVLGRLHQCYSRKWFHNAPVILVVTGRRNDAWVRSYDGHNSLETDAAIVMDHMILAAESEGVSTCWVIAFDTEIVSNVLGLNKDEIPLLITPLGYYPEGYEKREMPERKSLDELVTYY